MMSTSGCRLRDLKKTLQMFSEVKSLHTVNNVKNSMSIIHAKLFLSIADAEMDGDVMIGAYETGLFLPLCPLWENGSCFDY